ncbi:MAG: ZIP family metal transporter, partial [Pyrinomonadaceae bacterium]
MSVGVITIYAIALAAANFLGGLIITSSIFYRRVEGYFNYLIALSAGFMLAVTFFEIIPRSVELWIRRSPVRVDFVDLSIPMALLLAGYLMIHLFEHTIVPHFHFGEETHKDALISPSATFTAIGGLMIHTFFDGVSIAAAFIVSFKVGFLVFLAIILHKIPEGLTAASIMLAAGRSSTAARFVALITGLATIAGALSVTLLNLRLNDIAAFALPLSAGVTLYVAASDLIPEINQKDGKNPVISFFVFI